MKTAKYNVGDKVRIVSKWKKGVSVNKDGGMDKWRGKVMTIRGIEQFGPLNAYFMEEDHKENFGMGWAWSEDEIEGLAKDRNKNCNMKIVITSDGKETLARLYDGKNVIKTATAECSSKDTFDFEEGAKIACDRLMSSAKKRKYKVGDKVRVTGNTCYHLAKIGEVITLERYMGVDCKGRRSWYFKENGGYIVENDFDPVNASDKKKNKKKKFVPHIEDELCHYGNLGDPTNYKDAVGRSLVVGDTVELFAENGNSRGEFPIVCSIIAWGEKREKIFVMGIETDCDDKKGTTGKWKIVKKRSFEDVKDGEVIHTLKYIKSES